MVREKKSMARWYDGWSAARPHLARTGEVADLRGDVEKALQNLSQEFEETVDQRLYAAPPELMIELQEKADRVEPLGMRVSRLETLLKQRTSELQSVLRRITDLTLELQEHETHPSTIGFNNNCIKQFIAALSDDIVLKVIDDEDVAATDLNAAAANTIRHRLTVRAETALGNLHTWLNFEPTITPAKTVADADVGAPTVEWAVDAAGTPAFLKGVLEVFLIPDVDAGATKTYVATDLYSLTVDVSGLAIAANVANVVKTFNVI